MQKQLRPNPDFGREAHRLEPPAPLPTQWYGPQPTHKGSTQQPSRCCSTPKPQRWLQHPGLCPQWPQVATCSSPKPRRGPLCSRFKATKVAPALQHQGSTFQNQSPTLQNQDSTLQNQGPTVQNQLGGSALHNHKRAPALMRLGRKGGSCTLPSQGPALPRLEKALCTHVSAPGRRASVPMNTGWLSTAFTCGTHAHMHLYQ